MLGRSPALRKTIDILRSNQRTFDKSVNRELYSTFLRSNSLVNAGQSITEELGTILRNVREDISEAIGTNNIHAAGLREVEASLGTEPPELVLNHLVRELALATERSSSLETRTRPIFGGVGEAPGRPSESRDKFQHRCADRPCQPSCS